MKHCKHKNLVRIVDSYIHKNVVSIVMEYVAWCYGCVGQAQNPPALLEYNIREHYLETSGQFVRRLGSWFGIQIDRKKGEVHNDVPEATNGTITKNGNGYMPNDLDSNYSGSVFPKATNTSGTENTSLQNSSKANTVSGAVVDFASPEFPLLPVKNQIKPEKKTMAKRSIKSINKSISICLGDSLGSV